MNDSIIQSDNFSTLRYVNNLWDHNKSREAMFLFEQYHNQLEFNDNIKLIYIAYIAFSVRNSGSVDITRIDIKLNKNYLGERNSFLGEWRSIPNTEDQSQTLKQCKNTDIQTVKDIFMRNQCSFVAGRQIPNRDVSLYFATTLRNIAILLEISIANNGACTVVVKSKNDSSGLHIERSDIDIVVINCGRTQKSFAAENSQEILCHLQEINVLGPIEICKSMVKYWRKNVNIGKVKRKNKKLHQIALTSSLAGVIASPKASGYSMTKVGI